MFSKRCFSEWCVQRAVGIRKRRRHQKALKHWCFQVFFIPLKGFPLSQAEVRNLKNTVWKTAFGTLRANIQSRNVASRTSTSCHDTLHTSVCQNMMLTHTHTNTYIHSASWGPIFLETARNPDNERPQALNRQLNIDDRQMTHLICVHLKCDLYDFFRGHFGPASCSFSCIKGPKIPPKQVI